MNIRFWGVRGSIPSPGKDTVRYGGNTSCVSIDLDDTTTLILDAGSGIRNLGKLLANEEKDVVLLLTHIHWDHIQGFPFFRPLLMKGRRVMLLTNNKPEWIDKLLAQMDGFYFPLSVDRIPAKLDIIEESIETFFGKFGISATSVQTNHPVECLGYRLEKNGSSVVYMPDNELFTPGDFITTFDEFVSFCQDTDLLIHDAQYVQTDMPEKAGWGHSVVEHVCKLAVSAGVKTLVLFHHDPDRTDEAINLIEQDARSFLAGEKSSVECLAAYEGLSVVLPVVNSLYKIPA